MDFKKILIRSSPRFGILGVVSILVGIIISALHYQGRTGEKYSFLNHFVSELGEFSYSEFALAFNLGLILGGIFFLVLVLGLALYIGSWHGWVLGVTGGIFSLSGLMLGFFNMDRFVPHVITAVIFFIMGLLVPLFFSLYVLFHHLIM